MFCIETTYEVSVEALSSIKPENVAAKKCALFQNPPLYAYLLKPRGHKIVEGNFQQVFSYDDFLSLEHMLQTGWVDYKKSGTIVKLGMNNRWLFFC